MEEAQSVGMLMDSTSSKIQQLQKAFAELESHRAITLNMKWKELEEHFHGLERSLKRRFVELEDQEKEFENKTVESQKLLEKREADILAKEQASLGRLQEKRDAAVFAISTALGKHREVSSINAPVVTSFPGGAHIVEEKTSDSMVAENNVEISNSFEIENVVVTENGNVEVMSYPQLIQLCQEMDAEGLHKFVSDNRKNLAAVREEIPIALKTAADPACLILDSLEDFYRVDVPSLDGKKDSTLLGLRRTCIMLMECLCMMLTNTDTGSLSDVISEDSKVRARAIAEAWKPKLNDLDMDASNGNSLEAHAFLQLLATFGIASDFDQEDIYKLIPTVSRRRQTADLCRSLGVSDKMPGIIDVLISSGRQIDAVNLAFAFELTEQFPPVHLLKSYLKEARRISSPVKPGNTSPSAQNEVNERELTAHKAVIKCIEEHKLEDQCPLEALQKRVIQLEKAKADKKRVTEAAKPQPKRSRANGVGYGPRVPAIAADKTFYPRVTDRYPQYMYDRPYVYPAPTDNHCPSFLPSATYNLPAGHGNYFCNGFQYQVPYLH